MHSGRAPASSAATRIDISHLTPHHPLRIAPSILAADLAWGTRAAGIAKACRYQMPSCACSLASSAQGMYWDIEREAQGAHAASRE